MEKIDFIYFDAISNPGLIINFVIAIIIFAFLKSFFGLISHVDTNHELADKDNVAFGISLAGGVISIAIVLSSAIYREPVFETIDFMISIIIYGFLGVLLMILARIIFDRIAFNNFPIGEEIVKGNVAAAILDFGNMVATSIIIYAVLIWVSDNGFKGVIDILCAYIVSQIILTLIIKIRIKAFKYKFKKDCEEYFFAGNVALALRFVGFRIGAAYAMTAASNMMVYEMFNNYIFLLIWALAALVAILALGILSLFAQKVILYKVDINHEILENNNIAIGAVQCAIYLSLGLLLAQFIG